MIIGRGHKSDIIDINFSFGSESMLITAFGILDTGATTTNVPIGVLAANKNNISKEVLIEEVEKLKLLFSKESIYSKIGDGSSTIGIPTYISNVVIITSAGAVHIDRLNIILTLCTNFDTILVGRDFILSHSNLYNYNRHLAIDNYDVNSYNEYYGKLNLDIVDIGEIMSVCSII